MESFVGLGWEQLGDSFLSGSVALGVCVGELHARYTQKSPQISSEKIRIEMGVPHLSRKRRVRS